MAEVIDFSPRAPVKPAGKPERTHAERAASAVRSHDTRRVNKVWNAFHTVPWLFKQLESDIADLIKRRMGEAEAHLAYAYAELEELKRELHARPPEPRTRD